MNREGQFGKRKKQQRQQGKASRFRVLLFHYLILVSDDLLPRDFEYIIMKTTGKQQTNVENS